MNGQQVCVKQTNNYNPDSSGTINKKKWERKVNALSVVLQHSIDLAKYKDLCLRENCSIGGGERESHIHFPSMGTRGGGQKRQVITGQSAGIQQLGLPGCCIPKAQCLSSACNLQSVIIKVLTPRLDFIPASFQVGF